MDEVVLFNPGDSIGNFHDYHEAVQTAQIYQDKHTDSGHVLVVKSEKGAPSFDIFIEEQQLDNGQSSFKPAQRYTVSKKL
ncbi:MAG TPA: hypothetical protein H9875_05420 [Candidatus Levilactobacillus faecigallinarum]|uniref:Uncharacterized protein n=1 Tax=Candidatus Levilactobacillus faecigallinarum TaxID=2838638 RepID=A0A9D1QU78_9LACO|nr:hypothetical protein [Candidatus Levilactobacillus faecigallinarum]